MGARGKKRHMITKWFTSILCGAALIGITLNGALPAAAEQAPDKNGPGVARVSILEGSAVVERGDSKSQVAAVINAPLLPGDYISTGRSSRAELQFDGYTAVRLGNGVQARITSNDPNNRGLQIADGTVELGIVHAARPFTVDTPSVSVRAQEAGDYRISINQDGSTWVSVRHGSAEIITPDRSYTLDSGRTLVARGSAAHPSIAYTSEVGFDSFDDFSAKRDRTMIAALNASPNVSPNIAGYDNLDAYGQWQNVAGYGQAWVPNQSSNWAPYQNGSWTWEGGYGWTWVAAEPWGWAPYHYGRWFYANGYGWAWYPPAYTAYSAPPVWSPALVGFFGLGLNVGGPGWNVGIGVGDSGYGGYGGYGDSGYGDSGYGYGGYGFGYPGIAWYPLAPYDPYYAWYPGWAWTGFAWGWPVYGYGCCGFGGGGNRVVNIVNIRNYYGRFGHHALTGTLRGNFTHGNFTHNVSIDPRHIARMGSIHGAVPITPTRDNLRFSNRNVSAPVRMSRTFDSPRFASNRAIAARSSFAEQQRAVSQAIHSTAGRENAPVSRANNPARMQTGRENAPVSRANSQVRMETGTQTRQNATIAHANAPGMRESAPTGSWQRFNEERGTQSGQAAMNSRQQSAQFARGSEGTREPAASREERAPSDSWSRFSQSRGNAGAAYSRSESYGGAGSRGNSYPSYSRGNSYPSYSRGNSSPSYSRGDSSPSYSRGNSYPSYSRGNSYPSYSRGDSYPSYSRGNSYQSYSRGNSYPSYPRGNSYSSYPGGNSGASYSRGGPGPSNARPSGGGSPPHPSGGGGGNGGHGGRPPQ
jgi:FecR protein